VETTEITELVDSARLFSGFSSAEEKLLEEVGPEVIPHLSRVTDEFYKALSVVPKAQQFLDGRTEKLKTTHTNWLEYVFRGPYDDKYAAAMYEVGHVHFQVKLPLEFMEGGMTLILGALTPVIAESCGDDMQRFTRILCAINAALGFSLIIMQKSYQLSTLEGELDNFLQVTGMSRKLFDKLSQTNL